MEAAISKEAVPDEFDELWDALFVHDGWKHGVSLLVDETGFDSSSLSVEDVRAIADICAKRGAELGPARIAIFVARDLEYGMNRMWMAFVEGKWGAIPELFRSRGEAIAWLTV